MERALEEPGVLLIRRARITTYLNGGIGPDGLTVDEKGNVYVAHVDTGEVVVLTPKGKIIGSPGSPSSAAWWAVKRPAEGSKPSATGVPS